MNIELKNVKYFAAGSEETACFTATIYIDGKKAGDASNDGHGGQTRVHLSSPEQYEAVKAHALTLPEPSEYEVVEGFIDDLLQDFLLQRDFKRDITKKFVYLLQDGTLCTTKVIPELAKHVAMGEEVFRNKIKSWKNPPAKILNFMPEADAFAIYKKAVG